MSALSDYFTSLAAKIRGKTGSAATMTPNEMVDAIDDVYNAAKVGTATAGDVLSTKTFTNASTVGASGSMTNNGAVNKTLDCTTNNDSYTVPAGYHNGSGTVNISKQTKSVTPTSSQQIITPDSGKVLSQVTVAAAPLYRGTASPEPWDTRTLYPTSPYIGLSSVTITESLRKTFEASIDLTYAYSVNWNVAGLNRRRIYCLCMASSVDGQTDTVSVSITAGATIIATKRATGTFSASGYTYTTIDYVLFQPTNSDILTVEVKFANQAISGSHGYYHGCVAEVLR